MTDLHQREDFGDAAKLSKMSGFMISPGIHWRHYVAHLPPKRSVRWNTLNH